jgi:hypothetical protein
LFDDDAVAIYILEIIFSRLRDSQRKNDRPRGFYVTCKKAIFGHDVADDDVLV